MKTEETWPNIPRKPRVSLSRVLYVFFVYELFTLQQRCTHDTSDYFPIFFSGYSVSPPVLNTEDSVATAGRRRPRHALDANSSSCQLVVVSRSHAYAGFRLQISRSLQRIVPSPALCLLQYVISPNAPIRFTCGELELIRHRSRSYTLVPSREPPKYGCTIT